MCEPESMFDNAETGEAAHNCITRHSPAPLRFRRMFLRLELCWHRFPTPAARRYPVNLPDFLVPERYTTGLPHRNQFVA
jgi:hypothetical protein